MPNVAEYFPSTYLKASDLKGASPTVTIERVEYEAVQQNQLQQDRGDCAVTRHGGLAWCATRSGVSRTRMENHSMKSGSDSATSASSAAPPSLF